MKVVPTLMLVLVVIAASGQQDASRESHYNLKKGLALEGYDPVSYFSGKPLEGKSSLTLTYKGVTYWFALATNRSKFQENPEKYEPAYGGWCAYAMGETGEKVKVDPETFKVVGGKLYLFYNFWGNNTLTDWNRDEKKLLERANQNWQKAINR